ncbi:MAG: winged helix DNA-binding domain-containing protein [Bacteroidales bacterium]|jgi:hypothetical protein|nr:winged helix DNA-binding domain-containing protein [Bacteroidales bacterium]
MVKNIRMLSQQLAQPLFDHPRELVSWMGAIQAQDCIMSKWAVGIRLKSGSLSQVEKALESGEIIRTHVLRPTWHMVVAEDVRWMLQLTGKRIKSACLSWGKNFGIDEPIYSKSYKQLEKILKNNRHLTRLEIGEELSSSGTIADKSQLNCVLSLAETDGLICNGIEKNKKHTYALMDERVPPAKKLYKDEALAMLAQKYFRSHSPASLQDFTWWSGLTITEAKHAIKLIETELVTDRFDSENFYLHESYTQANEVDGALHLLPPYDEFLISYKERVHVLEKKHYPKAFTSYGIFYPVILQNGKIIGNWKKTTKKNLISIETSFFDKQSKTGRKHIKPAEERYKSFITGNRLKSS